MTNISPIWCFALPFFLLRSLQIVKKILLQIVKILNNKQGDHPLIISSDKRAFETAIFTEVEEEQVELKIAIILR